jgi:acrylyl-CoA reductase (NADPH)
MFRTILIEKSGDEQSVSLRDLPDERLPEGDVLVRVSASTLNYKDALAITGRGAVVREFPMVPGIDFAGVVEASGHKGFSPGDQVVLNGWGLGESRWGGLAELSRVSGDWLIPLPGAFTPMRAMALGTAGYTAALALMALERHGVTPAKGPVLVTGAGGGVGGVAVMLLHARGYRVIASTGRVHEADYLRGLGADEIMDRAELDVPARPLARERWAGAIDSVGGQTLANACAGAGQDGVVAACGLAGSMGFPASVAPFILRGVTLAGINSVYRPIADRMAAWAMLERHVDIAKLAGMTRRIGLEDVIGAAGDLLDGRVRGRLVVDIAQNG